MKELSSVPSTLTKKLKQLLTCGAVFERLPQPALVEAFSNLAENNLSVGFRPWSLAREPLGRSILANPQSPTMQR